MVLEVFRDFIVESDTFGSEAVPSQSLVTLTESSDQFLGFAGLDWHCMYVIRVIVIHNKEIFVASCGCYGVSSWEVGSHEFLESLWGDSVVYVVGLDCLDV